MTDLVPTSLSTHGRIVQSGFRPHPLLRASHLQTIVPALLRKRPEVEFRRQRLELPDGDFVDLGWAGEHHACGPIAILVHGLGGTFESKYIRGLSSKMVSHGWRVCALQLRGGGPDGNRLARSYHHGDTADLRHLWHLLRSREPEAFIAAVGWSLGGNVLLKALGEEGYAAPVDHACAVSVPFRLRECAEHMRQGFARVYQDELLTSLKQMVRRKNMIQPVRRPANLQRALAAKDFFEFDDAFTAPLNGFASAEDYYARACCRPFLAKVRRPTLILHAKDDPFMVPTVLPDAAELSTSITLELSTHGGHVGYVSAGTLGRPHCWSELRICDELVAAAAKHQPSMMVNLRAAA